MAIIIDILYNIEGTRYGHTMFVFLALILRSTETY